MEAKNSEDKREIITNASDSSRETRGVFIRFLTNSAVRLIVALLAATALFLFVMAPLGAKYVLSNQFGFSCLLVSYHLLTFIIAIRHAGVKTIGELVATCGLSMPNPGAVILAAAGGGACAFAALWLARFEAGPQNREFGFALGITGPAIILVPFIEEVVYRGCLLRELRKSFSMTVATIIDTAVFLAPHWHQVVHSSAGLISVSTIGVILCSIRGLTSNLWIAVTFHILYDFTVFH